MIKIMKIAILRTELFQELNVTNKNSRLMLCHIYGMVSSFLFTVSCLLLLFECKAVNVQLKISN